MAREPGPVGGGLALLDPLLRGPTLVVEVDDGPVRSCERGYDETHSRKEFSEVMLDLGDHPSRSIPGRCLIVEASVADQRRVAGSTAGPRADRRWPAPGRHWPAGGSRTSHPGVPAPS